MNVIQSYWDGKLGFMNEDLDSEYTFDQQSTPPLYAGDPNSLVYQMSHTVEEVEFTPFLSRFHLEPDFLADVTETFTLIPPMCGPHRFKTYAVPPTVNNPPPATWCPDTTTGACNPACYPLNMVTSLTGTNRGSILIHDAKLAARLPTSVYTGGEVVQSFNVYKFGGYDTNNPPVPLLIPGNLLASGTVPTSQQTASQVLLSNSQSQIAAPGTPGLDLTLDFGCDWCANLVNWPDPAIPQYLANLPPSTMWPPLTPSGPVVPRPSNLAPLALADATSLYTAVKGILIPQPAASEFDGLGCPLVASNHLVFHIEFLPTVLSVAQLCQAAGFLYCQVVSSLRSYKTSKGVGTHSAHTIGMAMDLNLWLQAGAGARCQFCNEACFRHVFKAHFPVYQAQPGDPDLRLTPPKTSYVRADLTATEQMVFDTGFILKLASMGHVYSINNNAKKRNVGPDWTSTIPESQAVFEYAPRFEEPLKNSAIVIPYVPIWIHPDFK